MKHRLFVAIPLPEELKPRVEKLQRRLDKLGLPVVWEKLDKIHLTLNFLGKVPSEELSNVKRAMAQTAKNIRPFELDIRFLETLYLRHEESLIYLYPGKSEELNILQKELCQEFNNLKYPQPRQFLPHFTIGRFKRTDPETTKAGMDKISNIEIDPLGQVTIDSMVLFESFVSQAGSHYQKLAEFSFRFEETDAQW